MAKDKNKKKIDLLTLDNGFKLDIKNEYSDEFYEEFIKEFQQNKRRRLFYRFVKRSFDIFTSLFALILLSPILLVIAIAIKIDSKGPVIYKQLRVGRNAKPFMCYKFRSMSTTAPKNCPTSQLENPDQYYTKVGRFLRKTSLDELPQLWCCVIGTMSLIGYRPLVLNEEKCNKMREELGVFVARPGVSGYAQVHGRDDVYYKNKAIIDAQYVKNRTLWFDLKLVFQTITCVFTKRGNRTKVENNAPANAKGKDVQNSSDAQAKGE